MTYRELVQAVKAEIRAEHAAIEGTDDDVESRLYLFKPGTLIRDPLPPFLLSTVGAKDLTFKVIIPEVIKQHAFTMAATGLVVSKIEPPKPPDQQTDDEREALGRREIPEGWPDYSAWPTRDELAIDVYDAERHESWLARILRHSERKPELGVWRSAGVDNATGRVVDEIRSALR
jgi:hypothetical protein